MTVAVYAAVEGRIDHYTVRLPGGSIRIRVGKNVKAKLRWAIHDGRDEEGMSRWKYVQRELDITLEEARRMVLRAAALCTQERGLISNQELPHLLELVEQS